MESQGWRLGEGTLRTQECPCAPHAGRGPSPISRVILICGCGWKRRGPGEVGRQASHVWARERAPPGPPFQAGTWPGPSWSRSPPPEEAKPGHEAHVPLWTPLPCMQGWHSLGSPGAGRQARGSRTLT